MTTEELVNLPRYRPFFVARMLGIRASQLPRKDGGWSFADMIAYATIKGLLRGTFWINTGAWYPLGLLIPVVISPDYRFGSPHVLLSRITTATLHGMWKAEGGVRSHNAYCSIAEWYGVTPEEVQAAIQFEEAFPRIPEPPRKTRTEKADRVDWMLPSHFATGEAPLTTYEVKM